MDHGSLSRQIRLLVDQLGPDGRLRTVCPKCLGGSTAERSFSLIQRDGLVSYRCYRAKCGLSGIYSGRHYERKIKPLPPKPIRYEGITKPVPASLWEEKFKKYGISMEHISQQGIVLAAEVNRIKFPMYDYMGHEIGENLKAITSGQKPKSLVNRYNAVPLIHFPLGQNFSTRLVLVEDQISAMKVALIGYCASISGTNLELEGLSQLKQMGIKEIDLMLDGDSAGVAGTMRLARSLTPHFLVRSILLRNNTDPKDLSLEEIRECLYPEALL